MQGIANQIGKDLQRAVFVSEDEDGVVWQVGAGITRAPLACFEQAIRAFMSL
ncbi:MAG: hypothetical protein QY332_16000 [Anaerolineales bacterium]|nr:MAG: hypothetical protein QY332_16000 [Anaerolineales bacterium]